MNIVYLGTPDFAVLPLIRLIESGKHNIVAVVTNRDKPVGRKGVITPPPVKVVAQKYSIPVYQYDKIKVEGVEDLKKLNPDVMITCAFGQILSQEILNIAKFGVLNIHASLLPKYRGASPIHYAILNGEKETGITIMKTDIGIDTGNILISESISIGETETCGQLFERLSFLGADLIMKALEVIESGCAKFIKQDHSKATFTKMIKKQDAFIDWQDSAVNVYNKIRAFNPAPIAYCMIKGEPFKIYSAEVVDKNGVSGEIISCENNLVIACKQGAISLLKVQKAGGKPLDIKEFLKGNKFIKGEFFN